jgi:hypothetical protein
MIWAVNTLPAFKQQKITDSELFLRFFEYFLTLLKNALVIINLIVVQE